MSRDVFRAARPAVVLLVGFGLAVAFFAVCAKKMLPPSPDRFSPHLLEIHTKNRVTLELVFDEDVAAESVAVDSFLVTGADGTELVLRGAGRGRRGDRVELWTEPQSPQLYELHGTVQDVAGNVGRFRSRFRGSDRVDTIPPSVVRITPSPGSAGQARAVICVKFSEPIDTLTRLDYMLVPSRYDTLFRRSWGSDWRELSFAYRPAPGGSHDSLEEGTNVYFLLQSGLRDLENNRSREPAFTYFTPDSAFTGDLVHGRALWQQGPLGTGTVLFQARGGSAAAGDSSPVDESARTLEVRTAGIAPVLEDGSFAVRVASGTYEVFAVADTNGDGLVDLASRPVRFSTGAESVDVVLVPESLPKPINAYRR